MKKILKVVLLRPAEAAALCTVLYGIGNILLFTGTPQRGTQVLNLLAATPLMLLPIFFLLALVTILFGHRLSRTWFVALFVVFAVVAGQFVGLRIESLFSFGKGYGHDAFCYLVFLVGVGFLFLRLRRSIPATQV